MATGQYTGVGGVARKVKNDYIGIANVARKVKNGYIGVGGVARKFFSGLDTNLTIGEARNAGYWSNSAYMGRWLYDEDEEEGDTWVSFVNGNVRSLWDSNTITDGGTYDSLRYHFLGYYSNASTPDLSKYAFAFFCPTKNHADALAECIKNRYTKIRFGLAHWNDDGEDSLVNSGTYDRTIISVNSLGLCSDIKYKIPYTNSESYDFSTNSKYSSLYVVEILTDEYLCCYWGRPSWKFYFHVRFS